MRCLKTCPVVATKKIWAQRFNTALTRASGGRGVTRWCRTGDVFWCSVFFASLGLVPFPSNGKLTQVEKCRCGFFFAMGGNYCNLVDSFVGLPILRMGTWNGGWWMAARK
jgi:hypothetical protein